MIKSSIGKIRYSLEGDNRVNTDLHGSYFLAPNDWVLVTNDDGEVCDSFAPGVIRHIGVSPD